MIEIKGLNAGYGPVQVLYDFDFEAKSREKLAVVGPNGSGKSTFLKSIMGLTTIYSGSIKFEGRELAGLAPYAIAKLGISYLPQVGSTFENLTIRENLRMAGYVLDKESRDREIEASMEIFPMLWEYIDKPAKILSGGMRQMVAMGMALMRRPQVMMFDEPTGNLAPKLAFEVLDKIIEVTERFNITLIMVEQKAKMILEVCDRAYLLVIGRPVYAGDAKELLDHPKLGQIYLGIRP